MYKILWWLHAIVILVGGQCIPSSKSINGWRIASAAWVTSAFEIACPWPPPFTSQRSFPVAITETSTLRWKLENMLKCGFIYVKKADYLFWNVEIFKILTWSQILWQAGLAHRWALFASGSKLKQHLLPALDHPYFDMSFLAVLEFAEYCSSIHKPENYQRIIKGLF